MYCDICTYNYSTVRDMKELARLRLRSQSICCSYLFAFYNVRPRCYCFHISIRDVSKIFSAILSVSVEIHFKTER